MLFRSDPKLLDHFREFHPCALRAQNRRECEDGHASGCIELSMESIKKNAYDDLQDLKAVMRFSRNGWGLKGVG